VFLLGELNMADYQRDLDRIVHELNQTSSRDAAEKNESPAHSAGPGALMPLLSQAVNEGASDILLLAGSPPALRVRGNLKLQRAAALTHEDIRHLVLPVLGKAEYAVLQTEKSVDAAFNTEAGRFRLNVHYQRGTLAASIRLLPRQMPTIASLNLPESVGRVAGLRQGLVLVTGPTGCGKSSTLAAIVDLINSKRACHIVTIEEPVEFVHANRSAIVEQIEVGRDTPGFLNSLRSILRQSPDVILVGEMRDPETIAMALTAAETGHLVLSTLHTNDTSQAISRILDSFPAANQPQIRQQFSLALATIFAQQLVPSLDGRTRYPALEIMMGTDAIRNLIRQGQDQQLRSQLLISRTLGMTTMEHSLAELVRAGKIARETAFSHCFRTDEMRRVLDG
jgi:twitching motility protein PilT